MALGSQGFTNARQRVTGAQAAIDANPDLQRLLQQYGRQTEGMGLGRHAQAHVPTALATQELLNQNGIEIPKGYDFDIGSGQVHKEEGIPWWAWTLPAVGVLGPMAINGIAGAGAAPAAGATGGATGTGTATATATGATSTMAGADAVAKALNKKYGGGFDWSSLLDLAPVVAGLAGGRGGPSSESAERLNQMTEAQMRRTDPLHQAITQLAWGRLPINARQGITAPTYSPLP